MVKTTKTVGELLDVLSKLKRDIPVVNSYGEEAVLVIEGCGKAREVEIS